MNKYGVNMINTISVKSTNANANINTTNTARVFRLALGAFLTFSMSSYCWADLDWSGFYRLEGYHINNPEISGGDNKSYGLHHLVLKPKIVAADNLTIYSRFDIFNQESSGFASNNQMGDIWGRGFSGQGSLNTVSERQKAGNLEVSHLYMTYNQEFGSFIVGRAPVHFGLGMTYNAGDGIFDHWYDTRDLLGYKLVLGSFSIFPMMAKVNEGDLHKSDDISEWLIQLQYKKPEAGLETGFFYRARQADWAANDANGGERGVNLNNELATNSVEAKEPPSQARSVGLYGYGSGSVVDKYAMRAMSLYLKWQMESWTLGVEASTQSGSTGIQDDITGRSIGLSGKGLAIELEKPFESKDSKWAGRIDFGYASGDDPVTTHQYEGFIFDRNYDIAFLMFNHPLGRVDYLRTALVTGRNDLTSEVNLADVEAISNTIYFSPKVTYRMTESWLVDVGLTTGWLNEDPLNANTSKGLGYELDVNFKFFRPHLVWVNSLGFFAPGQAFQGGSNSFETDLSLGFMSRVSISF